MSTTAAVAPVRASAGSPIFQRNRFQASLALLCLLTIGILLLSPDGFGDDVSESRFPSGALALSQSVWSQSTVFVERTQGLHPSRPASFGPRLDRKDLEGILFPVDTFVPTDSYGCPAPLSVNDPKKATPPERWIALVQRGGCAFSDKVRLAQQHGAIAVVFGDMSYSQGGLGGIGGLLTPWSPDETPDIFIPSAFVSRASYLSLLSTYKEEQTHVTDAQIHSAQSLFSPATPPSPSSLLAIDIAGNKSKVIGLNVVLSKEQDFAFPVMDLLLVLLFLPSLLTMATFISHRFRLARQRKLDRAPRDAVAQLPVFVWGRAEEKLGAAAVAATATVVPDTVMDEERDVGMNEQSSPPTESTLLLPPTTPTPPSRFSTLLAVITARLPAFLLTPTSSTLAPRKQHLFTQNLECSICLSDFEAGELVLELPCGHLFHRDEIVVWLVNSKRVCPICRKSITLVDGQAEEEEPVAIVVPRAVEGEDRSEPIPLVITSVPNRLGEEERAVASSSSVTLESPLRPTGPAATTG